MQWARYGIDKKSISANYYRESKHGDALFCKYCNGKMTFIKKTNKVPHFRVVDRKTHTCKYFGSAIEDMVNSCSSVVKLTRKNYESPIFDISIGTTTILDQSLALNNKQDQDLYQLQGIRVPQEKPIFKFIFDLYELFLKHEYDRILQFRFVVTESNNTEKLKSEELIPSYKDITLLDEKGRLGDRKRFFVGTILSARETPKKNIEVTLRGEKTEAGYYVNHKVIFMSKILNELGLRIKDFYKNRQLITYGKLKMAETKREVISFVSGYNDFDFARYTSLDGDWLDSQSKRKIDEFLYTRCINHTVLNSLVIKDYFPQANHMNPPGWVLFLKSAVVALGYIEDSENSIEQRKSEIKENYLDSQNFSYVSISSADLEDNFAGLKVKLHTIQPNLQLNFFES